MPQYFIGFIFKGTFKKEIVKVDGLFLELTPFQDISFIYLFT